MELKTNAIVIKSIDYKDNDKILSLFTFDRGIIIANIRGVKKAGAKLKYASEPFCFAEFILNEKSNRFIVTNVSYIDSFYNLRMNLKKYFTANILLESINKYCYDGMEFPELFLLVINVIKTINYIEDKEFVSIIKFLIILCDYLGYSIFTEGCNSCGLDIEKKVYFDFENAQFYCERCKNSDFTELRIDTYNVLKCINESDIEEINDKDFKSENLKYALKFLNYYLQYKTEIMLVSIQELIKNL